MRTPLYCICKMIYLTLRSGVRSGSRFAYAGLRLASEVRPPSAEHLTSGAIHTCHNSHIDFSGIIGHIAGENQKNKVLYRDVPYLPVQASVPATVRSLN